MDSSLIVSIKNTILPNFIWPISVSILAYILFDRIGVWRKRKSISKLGIIIIEELLEEVKNGIKNMEFILAINLNNTQFKSVLKLPYKSWRGMETIPDEVLLRIIETSGDVILSDFHPTTIRSHCKNYFDHMCSNVNQLIEKGNAINIQHFIINGKYIESARNVQILLESTRRLLIQNCIDPFPK
jgi:hypothetical protein